MTEVEYSADDFIVEEDNVVILTRDGWMKRQKEVKDLATTRLREGDQVMAVIAGSTRATAVFFTNFGIAYTCRIVDVPASTGYGEPIQRLFKFRDGERVVGAVSLDPRVTPNVTPAVEGQPAPAHAVAVTSDGYALRFNLDAFVEPSTRAGRRYARPAEGAEVVGVSAIDGTETMIVATRQARAVLCPVGEINYLAGPGRGVILIKIDPDDDRVLGFIASHGDRDLMPWRPRAARSRPSARRSTKSPAAAAKAGSCCSAASSRASFQMGRRSRSSGNSFIRYPFSVLRPECWCGAGTLVPADSMLDLTRCPLPVFEPECCVWSRTSQG